MPLIGTIVVMLAVALLAVPAHAKVFRAADTHPPDYPTVQAVEYMGKLIAERSGGRHSVRMYHSRQLGEEKETVSQTRAGGIDIDRVNLAPLNDIVPLTIVPTLPFLFRSVDHLHKVLDGPVGDDILAAFAAHGFVGLAFYDSGARSLYTVKSPVRSPADMTGLRIRVQQSEILAALMRALGAEPTPMPYGEVLTALKTGVIDGAENNWPSYEQSNHYLPARYLTLTEHGMAPEVVIMSKVVWDALPPEDQALVREAARDSVPYMRALWRERERKAEAAVRASGVVVTADFDKAPFIAAAAAVRQNFIRDPAMRDLVTRIDALH